ncbi:MAG: TadE/TadG family type IV pilus assembly protein [Candidatus Sericytochromatia bacterium]
MTKINLRQLVRLSRKEQGQSLVEFGLAMPVMMALLLFIISCGQLFSAQLVLINAAREGARVGAVGSTPEAIKKTAIAYMKQAGLSDENATIEIKGAQADSGNSVEVSTVYKLSLMVPIPGLPDPVPLKTQALMRIE